MIHNKNKAFTRCDVMAVITLTLIACSILTVSATMTVCMSSHRGEIMALLSTIDQAIAMYESDLGVLPPITKV